jgi:RNA:NAD 2'-phosphotransferase (TPT1/KptA family)
MTTTAELTALSKFLSFVLRHEPGAIGIELDAQGWIAIDRLVAACETHGRPMTRPQLEVAAGRMHRDGRVFYRSANGVWLTERVPPEYLSGAQSHRLTR